jgi:hypothetical protein
MAVYQTLDISGSISFDNWVLNSKIVAITNEDKRYPAKNLLDPRISKTYRTTQLFDERNGFFQIGLDLGSAMLPTIFAMINTNITKTTGNGAYLIGATNALFTTGTIIYDAFPLYETHTNVLRWYIDTPSTNPPGAEKQYWAFRMYPNDWGNGFTDDQYIEIGNLWLGEYQELKHNYGSKISQFDKSSKSQSFGGATYVDEINSGFSLTSEMPYVSRTARQSLVEGFSTYSKRSHVLLDFEPFINDITSEVGGLNAYYGKLDGIMNGSNQFNGFTNMQVSFREALG